MGVNEPRWSNGLQPMSHQEELVSDYLAQPKLRPRTRDHYGRVLRRLFLPYLADQGLQLGQVDQRVLDRWVTHLQQHGGTIKAELSAESIRSYAAAANHFLSWLKKEGELRSDARARAPRPDRRLLDVLSRQEIQRLEDAAPTERDKLIIRVLADTGIRLGELLTARVSSIRRQGQEAYLRVLGKGGRERDVPISPALARRLLRFAQRGRPQDANSERLWLSLRRRKSGNYAPLTDRGVQFMLKSTAEMAGITKRVHPHLLRHSYATWRLRQGANPIALKDDMGHRSLLMISNVYSHLQPSDRHAEYMKALRDEEDEG